MRISLGSGVTSDSRHTLFMIFFVQSFYFLALGLCLVMYDQQLQQSTSNGASAASSASSSSSAASDGAAPGDRRSGAANDVLTLDFLFAGGQFAMHPHLAVVLVFLLHGLLLGCCVGCLVERRSWCLDVVLTAELIFFTATLFFAAFRGLGWRLTCIGIDTVCAVVVALYVAGKREQQEVQFGGPQQMQQPQSISGSPVLV